MDDTASAQRRTGCMYTVQGLVWDKSCTQTARISERENHSAWYDFRKAYDSVAHVKIKRLIKALPIHPQVANTIIALMNKWAIVVKVGKTFIEPIYVKTGIYQGDTISPLTFILLTAHIAAYILNNIEITRACRGRQELAAFMNDYKTHAPSKRAAILIKDALQKAAAEVGLSLNERKCGT